MQLKNSFIGLVVALVFLIGITSVLAEWTNPPLGSIPEGSNSDAPINISPTAQTKNGSLTFEGTVSGGQVVAIDKIGVGAGVLGTIDDTVAVLDVNGQVKITPVVPLGAGNYVLAASDSTGLASWVLPSSLIGTNGLTVGYGIDEAQFALSSRTVAIEPTETQRRINDSCPPNTAMFGINEDGSTTTPVQYCRPFVTNVTTPAGSGIAGGSVGPVSLNLQAGGGLSKVGNQIRVSFTAAYSGLSTTTNNPLKFDNYQCGPFGTGSNQGEYWQYSSSTSRWECGRLYGATPPGESIMQIRGISTPPVCPTSLATYGAWTDLGPGPVQEYAIPGSTATHYVRTCYRNSVAGNDRLCQVIYLKQRSDAAPTNPPACSTLTPTNTWVSAGATQEYAGDSTHFNNVNTCYRCF